MNKTNDLKSYKSKKLEKHWQNLCYLARHKFYVFKFRKLTGLSFRRALLHDLSKLRPSEWSKFATEFYRSDGRFPVEPSTDFQRARWLHHQRNEHHWQFWTLVSSVGSHGEMKMITFPIPTDVLREMLTDWLSVEFVKHGKVFLKKWFKKNSSKMLLTPDTRWRLEQLIEEVQNIIETNDKWRWARGELKSEKEN